MCPGSVTILFSELAVDIEGSTGEKVYTVSISLVEEIIKIIRNGVNTEVYLKLSTTVTGNFFLLPSSQNNHTEAYINCKCSANNSGLLLTSSTSKLIHIHYLCSAMWRYLYSNGTFFSCSLCVCWLLWLYPSPPIILRLVIPPNLILPDYWSVGFFIKSNRATYFS